MNIKRRPNQFFIGWDVGGWNCDKNSRSRDAIVILDSNCQIYGTPWRNNLRESIVRAANTRDWLCEVFQKCNANLPTSDTQVVMAVDTPLGFPVAFLNLVTNLKPIAEEPSDVSGENPYLFRQTELMLFGSGFAPLSTIKDMIGSQATKGMHVLAKFSPVVESCGVWTDETKLLRTIETYPAVCENTEKIKNLTEKFHPTFKPKSDDEKDALICALITYLFNQEEQLDTPPSNISPREGWIWKPCSKELKVADVE